MATTALEEAATVASEYIYSIDNLPSEVAYLLQEIKHRDIRTQELQEEIDKDTARYIRHSIRPLAAASSPLLAPSSSTVPQSPSKTASIPAKVSAAYTEIEELATQKEELAQRLVGLIERTRTRLDCELTRVRTLQGDSADYTSLTPKPLVGLAADSMKMPVLAVTESLKSALVGSPLAESSRQTTPGLPGSPVAVSTPGSTAYKRRRVNSSAGPSIKVPATTWSHKRSASPTVQLSSSAPTTHQRSRLSRQIHPPAKTDAEEMDVDGEEEEADDGDGDDRLYCYCQKQSYGDMIACDNEGDCPYEWFHLSCAGIRGATPERWYCDPCKAKLAEKVGAGTARKGRKK